MTAERLEAENIRHKESNANLHAVLDCLRKENQRLKETEPADTNSCAGERSEIGLLLGEQWLLYEDL